MDMFGVQARKELELLQANYDLLKKDYEETVQQLGEALQQVEAEAHYSQENKAAAEAALRAMQEELNQAKNDRDQWKRMAELSQERAEAWQRKDNEHYTQVCIGLATICEAFDLEFHGKGE